MGGITQKKTFQPAWTWLRNATCINWNSPNKQVCQRWCRWLGVVRLGRVLSGRYQYLQDHTAPNHPGISVDNSSVLPLQKTSGFDSTIEKAPLKSPMILGVVPASHEGCAGSRHPSFEAQQRGTNLGLVGEGNWFLSFQGPNVRCSYVVFLGGMFVKQDQPGFNTRQMWILTRLTRQ
jgi:hypothetical protein